MVYVEIIHGSPPFLSEETQLWYTRMKIDSTASEVSKVMYKYYLTDENAISIEDDVSGESFKMTKCKQRKKTNAAYCVQQLVPFGLIKEKFYYN